MFMKVKELIRVLNSILNIQELETIAAASSLDSVDVTEDGVKAVNEKIKGLYTLDAAVNNPQIIDQIKKNLYPAIKGELLGNVDTEIDAVSRSLFGEEESRIILSADFTKDKIKHFRELTEKVLKSKLKDEDKQRLVDGYSRQINEIQAKHAEEIKKLQTDIQNKDQEFRDSVIKSRFRETAMGYTLQPAYDIKDVKDVIFTNIYDKIRAKATLKLAPTGEIEVYQKDQPELKLFDGAKQIGIKDLIETEMQPFVLKAPVKPGTKPQGKPTRTPERKIVSDLPINPMAQDMLAASEHFNNP